VRETGTSVVSVQYRLAPEWGAPAPAVDVLAALEWARTQELGSRAILAGDSSGANAAFVAALMLKERNVDDVEGLVLLYPFLDPERGYPSHETYAEGYFITGRTIETYWPPRDSRGRAGAAHGGLGRGGARRAAGRRRR